MWSEVANGFDLLALVATLGALLQAGWMLPVGPGSGETQARRYAEGYFVATLGLITLTTATALLARSADISGLPLEHLGPVIRQVLRQTHFGHIWWVRVAALVVSWIAWWTLALHHRRCWVGLGILCLLVEAWGWSVTAYPGDHGSYILAARVAVLHVFSAGLWGWYGTVLGSPCWVALPDGVSTCLEPVPC